LSLILALAAGLVPAGGASSSTSRVKMGGVVTIDNVSGSTWTCGFNPYVQAESAGQQWAAGILYEPLWYINALNNSSKPWLATHYTWSNGNKTLTFTIRSGVKWTDGKPLTAKDVAFTFNLLKKFKGLDLNALWTVLSSVSSSGNKVTIKFKKPAVPFFYYIADQTFILPQHIWSKIANPVTYNNPKPVGSGPFTLKSCSNQNIVYARNPHYWDAPRPYISEVQYPAFLDNQPGNLYLAQGKANWGGQFIPNVQAYYLNRDPKNRHIWYPPSTSNVQLYPNLKAWPTNILAVRKAISYALDRSQISKLGVYGYLPPANQTGIILPNYKNWYDKSMAGKFNYGYNPHKAVSLLQSAGFKKGSDGMFRDKSGRKLSLSMLNVGPYTDWVAEGQIVVRDLKAIGIDASAQNVSGDTHTAREQQGHFQLTYDQPGGGPTPYYMYYQMLDSVNTAPIGKNAPSNYERFQSAQVDSLLKSYSQTTSTSRQHQIINKIQQVMLQQVPVIPVLEGINWFQYDTSQIVGWPSKSNPYASPSPYNYPDWAVVLTTVHSK
jgi:peptide/nickel transport system substrate-binding protein